MTTPTPERRLCGISARGRRRFRATYPGPARSDSRPGDGPYRRSRSSGRSCHGTRRYRYARGADGRPDRCAVNVRQQQLRARQIREPRPPQKQQLPEIVSRRPPVTGRVCHPARRNCSPLGTCVPKTYLIRVTSPRRSVVRGAGERSPVTATPAPELYEEHDSDRRRAPTCRRRRHWSRDGAISCTPNSSYL
jgi:hypothetical protein